MTMVVKAIYNGSVFCPIEPVRLEPNTQVTVTLEVADNEERKEYGFFETALSMDLQGPPDWSSRFDEYLHAQKHGTNR